jgi:patatin-like phospholipase/acyl hydrolase
MVLVLKYLSNMTPGNFNVTELKVDKVMADPLKEINRESEHSSITINVKGFYYKNMEDASALAESFRKDLESSNLFKKVNIGPGKKLKKLKTEITMSMVY